MAKTKHLSTTAIVVLAANTMNGPGITTLPDVAANAGRLLFILLIVLASGMASFVCRRMVNALWSNDGCNQPIPIRNKGSVELLNVHEKFVDESCVPESSFLLHPSRVSTEGEVRGSYQNNSNVAQLEAEGRCCIRQPILELTSIVGQSREAFDSNDDKRTSTSIAFLMVASALCLGLAQMVRLLCTLFLFGHFFVALLNTTLIQLYSIH